MLATRPPGRISAGRELERRGHADRFECDVDTETVGHLHDQRERVLATVVDRDVRAEPQRALEAAVGEVDRDDPSRRVELCGEDCREADRAGADNRNDVPGRDRPVEHPDLERRREDVGEEQHLLVSQRCRGTCTRSCRRTGRALARPAVR
jgi:hypothetical protein